MAIQVLEYHHGLEPQSVWRMVNSNQFAPVAMPEKSIPYVQELGDFYASSSFYTKRHSLVSYLLKYTVSGEGVLEYGDSRYTLRADEVGFHNPGHFINLFKRSLGMTPGMYRSFWGQGQRRKLEGSV